MCQQMQNAKCEIGNNSDCLWPTCFSDPARPDTWIPRFHFHIWMYEATGEIWGLKATLSKLEFIQHEYKSQPPCLAIEKWAGSNIRSADISSYFTTINAASASARQGTGTKKMQALSIPKDQQGSPWISHLSLGFAEAWRFNIASSFVFWHKRRRPRKHQPCDV